MEFLVYALVLAVAAYLVPLALARLRHGRDASGGYRYCLQCGLQGRPQRHTRGSLWIELVLWCLLIVPGLIYSIWRLSTRTWACASCASTALVAPDCPAAQAQQRRFKS